MITGDGPWELRFTYPNGPGFYRFRHATHAAAIAFTVRHQYPGTRAIIRKVTP